MASTFRCSVILAMGVVVGCSIETIATDQDGTGPGTAGSSAHDDATLTGASSAADPTTLGTTTDHGTTRATPSDLGESHRGLYFACDVDEDCESGQCAAAEDGGFCTQPCGDRFDCQGAQVPDSGTPAFLCVDQGAGPVCLMQCLLHRDEPDAWPQGYGAICPDGWMCQRPSGVTSTDPRHQTVCFEDPARP